MIIFRTPHGSHLYGLAHAGSDYDEMVVTGGTRRAKQRVVGDRDVTTVSLKDFLYKAHSGAHQYLEALFSGMKTYEQPEYEPMIESYRIAAPFIRAKCLRTIGYFVHGDTLKRRRHGLRLALALREMSTEGRFNPTLSAEDAERFTLLATDLSGDALYAECMRIAEVQ